MAKTKPKPKVSLPRANKFGDVVTVDLKEYDRIRIRPDNIFVTL